MGRTLRRLVTRLRSRWKAYRLAFERRSYMKKALLIIGVYSTTSITTFLAATTVKDTCLIRVRFPPKHGTAVVAPSLVSHLSMSSLRHNNVTTLCSVPPITSRRRPVSEFLTDGTCACHRIRRLGALSRLVSCSTRNQGDKKIPEIHSPGQSKR